MNLDPLKLRCCETFGIADTRAWRFYLGKFLIGYYIRWLQDPLIGILYRLGLTKTKPIALVELEDMFDLKDFRP